MSSWSENIHRLELPPIYSIFECPITYLVQRFTEFQFIHFANRSLSNLSFDWVPWCPNTLSYFKNLEKMFCSLFLELMKLWQLLLNTLSKTLVLLQTSFVTKFAVLYPWNPIQWPFGSSIILEAVLWMTHLWIASFEKVKISQFWLLRGEQRGKTTFKIGNINSGPLYWSFCYMK